MDGVFRTRAPRDGAEASFLVLRANPLDDMASTAAISLRVKQGARLDLK